MEKVGSRPGPSVGLILATWALVPHSGLLSACSIRASRAQLLPTGPAIACTLSAVCAAGLGLGGGQRWEVGASWLQHGCSRATRASRGKVKACEVIAKSVCISSHACSC